LKPWTPGAKEIEEIKTLNDKYNHAKPSAKRFIPEQEIGVWAHGFNVWEGNPLCHSVNKDGKPTTGCSGIDAAQECKMKFMTKEASTYVTTTTIINNNSTSFITFSLLLHQQQQQ
jgi:hypothetical protein